jgi:hypothetical protein
VSTPEQWEMGGEIVDQGASHASFVAIFESWKEVLEKLEEVQKASAGLKKIGVGRTEDPTLVVARIVPALRDHAHVVSLIAQQLQSRLGGA